MSANGSLLADDLRKRAETLLADSSQSVTPTDLNDINRLAQELAIHQAELELQNEELRATQLALQNAKDRFSGLYENAPVGYVVLDASGIIRQTNGTWRAMLNRANDDFMGMPFTDAIVSEDAPIFLSRFRTFFRNPVEKQIVVRMKRKGAAPFFARIEAGPRTLQAAAVDAAEAPRRELLVIISDISDLQSAQQQIEDQNRELTQAQKILRESEKYLRSVIGTSADGFWAIDGHGRIVDVNDAYCAMSGYTREEILGMRIGDLDADEMSSETAARIQCIVENGSELFETQHRHRDGSIRPVEISASWMDEYGGRFVCFCRDLTQRKYREERIALLGRMLDEAPASITIHNTQGRFLFANRVTLALHGYDKQEDFLKINLHELDVPESEALLAERFRLIAETGEARFEVAHHRKDGSTFPLEVLAKAIEWRGESAVLSIASDITERKEAEKALEESEERFRDVVSHLPGAVFQFIRKPDGSIEIPFMSEGAATIFERSVADLQDASRLFENLHPDDFSRMWNSIEESARTMTPWGLEFRIGLGNRIKWLRGVSSPKELPDGGICWNGMLIDITETKKTEEALWQSEERFRTLFESLSAGSCINEIIYVNGKAIDYRILDVNPSFEKIMGIPRKEAKDALASQLYGTGKAPFLDILWRVDETGEAARFETFLEPIQRHLEFTVSRPSKGVVSMVFSDITDRKRAEEERENLQGQLLQAQKMEAVGTLAGGISHDFNNLLQGINGYAELLLLDKSETDPEYQSLKAIQGAGFRASDLVRQLLLFSRKAESTRKAIELQQEIAQAKKLLERTIPKMVDIQVITGGRLWKVMADPVQMEQLLLNLGTNAADAMPDGGRLVIEIANTTLDNEYANSHLGVQPGRYVLLTVSDTGHGMDRETIEKVYDPFFTTKEIGKGTGLGLASVYGIVKSHDGAIQCYSEVGKGTTFKIYFPAMEETEMDESGKAATKPTSGGSETILLVDDETAIREFAQQALTKFGYTALTASSGEEALELFVQRPGEIDLVIMDLSMPGMGGHRCLQEILKIDKAAKVVIASGYSVNGQVKESMTAGAAGYIGKPYRLQELLERVRQVLDFHFQGF